MAILVTLASSNPRRNHRVLPVTTGATTNWETLTLPAWVKRVEVINHGADALFISTEVADGDTAASHTGVPVPAAGAYSFPCGGPDGPFIAVRHASGSYAFALGLYGTERA